MTSLGFRGNEDINPIDISKVEPDVSKAPISKAPQGKTWLSRVVKYIPKGEAGNLRKESLKNVDVMSKISLLENVKPSSDAQEAPASLKNRNLSQVDIPEEQVDIPEEIDLTQDMVTDSPQYLESVQTLQNATETWKDPVLKEESDGTFTFSTDSYRCTITPQEDGKFQLTEERIKPEGSKRKQLIVLNNKTLASIIRRHNIQFEIQVPWDVKPMIQSLQNAVKTWTEPVLEQESEDTFSFKIGSIHHTIRPQEDGTFSIEEYEINPDNQEKLFIGGNSFKTLEDISENYEVKSEIPWNVDAMIQSLQEAAKTWKKPVLVQESDDTFSFDIKSKHYTITPQEDGTFMVLKYEINPESHEKELTGGKSYHSLEEISDKFRVQSEVPWDVQPAIKSLEEAVNTWTKPLLEKESEDTFYFDIKSKHYTITPQEDGKLMVLEYAIKDGGEKELKGGTSYNSLEEIRDKFRVQSQIPWEV